MNIVHNSTNQFVQIQGTIIKIINNYANYNLNIALTANFDQFRLIFGSLLRIKII